MMTFNSDKKKLCIAIGLIMASGIAFADTQAPAELPQAVAAAPAPQATAQTQVVAPQVASVATGVAAPTIALPPNVQIEPAKKVRKKMPGVGNYFLSEKNATPQAVVPSGNDGTRIVSMSNVFPNRVATPFAAPRALDNTNTDIHQDGSSLYIFPKGTEPFVIYVTGADPGDQVISLTIIPKKIPAQTVVLQADTQAAVRQQKTESYTQQLVDLLRRIAAGTTPEGFSKAAIASSVAISGDIHILPKERYSSTWLDVYRYTVINEGRSVIELSETSFYKKGVRAVSIYPNLTLAPSESTEVYVVADKTALDGGANGVQ